MEHDEYQASRITPEAHSFRASVCVPCYQEARRLDTGAFAAFLGAHPNVHIVFVDDGSTDETPAVLAKLAAEFPAQTTVVRLARNQGKAEAVRQGILAAMAQSPDYAGYWDADLATPLDCILDFSSILLGMPHVDLVLGARVALLGRDIERKPARHYLGRIFATAASITLNLPVYDTQCGAKLFRASPRFREIFGRPFGSRWVFDVEMIARYLSGGGQKRGLYEQDLPSWADVGESKVRPSDFIRSIGEMMNIYQAYPLGQPLRGAVAPLTGLFARYVGVGGLGTVCHYLILIVGVEAFRANPQYAAVVGATVGAIVNYFLNYTLTFASRVAHREAVPKFAVVAALSVILSAYGVRFATEHHVHYLIAQIGCTIVALGCGFLINRAWTFGARSDTAA